MTPPGLESPFDTRFLPLPNCMQMYPETFRRTIIFITWITRMCTNEILSLFSTVVILNFVNLIVQSTSACSESPSLDAAIPLSADCKPQLLISPASAKPENLCVGSLPEQLPLYPV